MYISGMECTSKRRKWKRFCGVPKCLTPQLRLAGAGHVLDVSVGNTHVLVSTTTGLFAAGGNTRGQLGVVPGLPSLISDDGEIKFERVAFPSRPQRTPLQDTWNAPAPAPPAFVTHV